MLAEQDAKTVPPLVPGKQAALAAARSLPVEVHLAGSPALHAIFEFSRAAQVPVAAPLVCR